MPNRSSHRRLTDLNEDQNIGLVGPRIASKSQASSYVQKTPMLIETIGVVNLTARGPATSGVNKRRRNLLLVNDSLPFLI